MKAHRIRRRAFFKTCGLALAGLSFAPVKALSSFPQGKNGERIIISPAGLQYLPVIKYDVDYVVAGGGLAGVCSAITAARAGLKVVLIQDRPVLGGNASSEVRLWVLGATCHMGNNNRWAREGGVHEEILVENMYRNREGNSIFFDALLLEKVWAEPNITLLLNTAVYNVEMENRQKVKKLFAFCSQNSTQYEVSGAYFCDCSGDGIVGYLAGASFRMGAEKAEEFGEKFVMPADYGNLLGHSMYFYSKDTGTPVKYVPPAFALKDIPANIPRFKRIARDSSGCRLWWLEWGDHLDRVFDSEKIKEELWKIVYGVWDYIKNSGTFEDVDNLTLEWISSIPGKRESRRFEGDYMLKQQDFIGQSRFKDAIAYGGWAIDLHPAAGAYSSYPGCTQHHSKGVYQIPYRCIYSKDISNLFFGGRLISVTHVAFGSTRVISTGTLCAQAAALATVLCLEKGISPRDVYEKNHIEELQKRLMQTGQYIPHLALENPADLVASAKLSAGETLELSELKEDGDWFDMSVDSAILLPFCAGKVPRFTFTVKAKQEASVEAEFYISSIFGNYTPDKRLAATKQTVPAGVSELKLNFNVSLDKDLYGFIVFKKNDNISLAHTDTRLTGVLSLFSYNIQVENEKDGIEGFPFFTPLRRPGGKNFAFQASSPLKSFDVSQLQTGVFRPASGSVNAWVAPLSAEKALVECKWKQSQKISKIVLWFDSDYDHPMESCLMGHPEDIMPFCVARYAIRNDRGEVIFETTDNHHSRNEITLEQPIHTSKLTIELYQKEKNVPISLFGVQAF